MPEPVLTFYDDPGAFLDAAGPVLAADPVVGSVIATVTARAHADRTCGVEAPETPTWWVTVEERGRLTSAGMRTAPFAPYPPFLLPMSAPAVTALARAVHARGEHLGGCNGALPAARLCAEETARLTGGTVTVDQHTRLFEALAVIDPPPVAGVLRRARPEEAGLALAWYDAFGREADEQAGRAPGTGHAEHHTLDDLERRVGLGLIWLLEDPSGEVAHLTAVSPPAYGFARIGPVYTPKRHRGRGYASYVVAELTGRGLAEGTRMCLFTDQANPTSNKIYEAIGYQRVVDMANIVVTEPGSGGGSAPAESSGRGSGK